METVKVNLMNLNPDPKNTRKHDSQNLEVIKNSLKKFGQYRPFVVQKTGMVIRVGNGMYEAMMQLGWSEASAIVMDITDAEATALSILDNKASDLSVFDEVRLAEILPTLPQDMMDLTGFAALAQQVFASSQAPSSASIPAENKPIDETVLAQTNTQCPKCGFAWMR